MALPNHLTESMITKGHLYSDTLTRGYFIAVNPYLISEGDIVIPIPDVEVIPGGGGAGGYDPFTMPPPFYEEVKKRKEEKAPEELIKEVRVRLIRQKKYRNFNIDVKLIEAEIKAKLMDEKMLSDKGFNIIVELKDI